MKYNANIDTYVIVKVIVILRPTGNKGGNI